MTSEAAPPKPRLRFAANLKWLFSELPFEQRFDAAAEAGFRGVEYSSPYEFRPERLRELLDGAGLKQVLINSPTGKDGSPTRYGTACLPDRVAEFRRGVVTALEYADALGAAVIHVPGAIRPADVSEDRAFGTYITNMAWAAEQASSMAVTLVVEAINQRDAPGFVLRSIEQAAAVVDAIGGDHIRVLFDIYHCQVSQGDITTRLRALMPVVGHIQVADVPDRAEPGTGEISWGHVFEQIRTSGYGGWIGCEYRPAGDTTEGLAWMFRFGQSPVNGDSPS